MRNKKDSSITDDALTKAKAIVLDFDLLTEGIRILQLMQRKSDGGGTNNTKFKSVICRDRKEFTTQLAKMLTTKNKSTEALRIYSSVNSRDLKKAVRHFKQCMLDADYGSEEMWEGLYFNIHNRFISSLMKPRNKLTPNFLLDLDQKDNDDVLEKLANLDINILKMYPTKQGWHFVTVPFNPAIFESNNCSIHTDGLLLLDY